jgi:RNA polymerase sigma-70 factor (ECF subfamily)
LDVLVVAALGGSGSALDELLAAVHPLALQYCRARLGRHETGLLSAEDVAQEVCVAVVKALLTYEPSERSFRAFVYGIASNKVADTFRSIARNRTEPVAELPDLPSAGQSPEDHILQVELGDWMGRLVSRLSARQREVITLRVVMRLSAEETAAIVGSTPGAVRVTQHRALTRLREIIEALPGARSARPYGIVVGE